MERRLHPTHDRAAIAGILGFPAAGLLSLLLFRWSAWAAVPAFLAVCSAAVASIGRSNRCPCPACGLSLHRPPSTSDFACEACGIIWETGNLTS